MSTLSRLKTVGISTGQPKIVKSLKEKTEINEGDTLTLEVEIYAKPEPKIVW